MAIFVQPWSSSRLCRGKHLLFAIRGNPWILYCFTSSWRRPIITAILSRPHLATESRITIRVFGDHFYFSSYFLSSAPIKLSNRKPFPTSEILVERDIEACRQGGVWGGTVFQGVRTWWSHEKGLRRGHKSHEKVLQTYLTTISKTSPHSWQQDSNLDLDLVQIRKNVMQDLYHVMHQRWWRYQGVVGVCARGGAHVEAAYVATKIA